MKDMNYGLQQSGYSVMPIQCVIPYITSKIHFP